jgi:hypothetical protein
MTYVPIVGPLAPRTPDASDINAGAADDVERGSRVRDRRTPDAGCSGLRLAFERVLLPTA